MEVGLAMALLDGNLESFIKAKLTTAKDEQEDVQDRVEGLERKILDEKPDQEIALVKEKLDDNEEEDEAPPLESGGQPSVEIWKPCKSCGAEIWKIEGHCLACGAAIDPPKRRCNAECCWRNDEAIAYANHHNSHPWWTLSCWSRNEKLQEVCQKVQRSWL